MPCDYKRYPADWKEIRVRILDRAKYECERCALPMYAVFQRDEQGKWVAIGGNLYLDTMQYAVSYEEARNVAKHSAEWCDEPGWKVCVLTIAHLDHDVTNNDPSNLQALCQRCHLRHDARFHASNAKQTRLERKGGRQTMTLPGME